MDGELRAIDDPAVDLATLQRRVRERAGALRPGELPATGEPPARLVAAPAQHPVAGSAQILPYGGPPVGPARRAVRRALRWYLWPLTAHLTGHNRAVAAVLAEQRRLLTWVGQENERLDLDLAGAGRRAARR